MRPAPEPAAGSPAAAPGRDALLPGVVLFTAGALALLGLPALPPLAWLAALAVPALLPWRWRALYACAALGFLLGAWRAQTVLDSRWPLARSDEEIQVTGRAISLPQQRLSSPSRKKPDPDAPPEAPRHDLRFLFAPDGPALPPRIRVSWSHSDQAVRGGDCWRFDLRMRAPHGSLNPGGYDYEQWLFEQGIGATASVRDAQPCEDHTGYRLLQARQRVADQLQAWLPGNPALGLIAGLAVGDRSLLQEEDWDTFRVTGTSHFFTLRLPSCRLYIS